MDPLDILVFSSLLIFCFLLAYFYYGKKQNEQFQIPNQLQQNRHLGRHEQLEQTNFWAPSAPNYNNEQYNNILFTQSEASAHLVLIMSDNRNPNETKTIEFFRKRFPLDWRPLSVLDISEFDDDNMNNMNNKNNNEKKRMLFLPSFHISLSKNVSQMYRFICLYGSRIATLLIRVQTTEERTGNLAEGQSQQEMQQLQGKSLEERRRQQGQRKFSRTGIPNNTNMHTMRNNTMRNNAIIMSQNRDKLSGLRVVVLSNSSDLVFLKSLNEILSLNLKIEERSSLKEMMDSWTTTNKNTNKTSELDNNPDIDNNNNIDNNKNNIDALFLLTSHTNPFVTNFCNRHRVYFFDFVSYLESRPQLATLTQFQFPLMQRTELDISGYRTFNTSQRIRSLKIFTAILGSPDVPETLVVNFLEMLSKSFLQAKRDVPEIDTFIESEMHLAPPEIDLHAGARKYFQKRGKIYVDFPNEENVAICSRVNQLCTKNLRDKLKIIVER